MRDLTVSLLATALFLGGTGAALAEGLAGEPQSPIDPTVILDSKPTFEQLDSDKDGMIAKTEVPIDHELNTLFANFDRDADQSLSRIEFDEYAEEDEEEAE